MDSLERGMLIKAQADIAESLKGIEKNLKELNDHNILHTTKVEAEHNKILETLKTMTDKYWWLIIVLIATLMTAVGFAPKFGLLT